MSAVLMIKKIWAGMGRLMKIQIFVKRERILNSLLMVLFLTLFLFVLLGAGQTAIADNGLGYGNNYKTTEKNTEEVIDQWELKYGPIMNADGTFQRNPDGTIKLIDPQVMVFPNWTVKASNAAGLEIGHFDLDLTHQALDFNDERSQEAIFRYGGIGFPSNSIFEIKNVTPGDRMSGTITIVNDCTYSIKLKMFVQCLFVEQPDDIFLARKLHIKSVSVGETKLV